VADDLGRAVIAECRRRLVDGFPPQVRASLEVLTDEEIWWRPNPGSNAVGNLVLHVCGSSRHFLGRGVGGSGYVRDRDAEFAERGPIPRDRLLAVLQEAADEVRTVMDALTPERLLEMSPLGPPHTVLALVVRTAHHWGVHAGQIVWATKMLRDRAFDELWYRTMGK
jgi:hypothetical protein